MAAINVTRYINSRVNRSFTRIFRRLVRGFAGFTRSSRQSDTVPVGRLVESQAGRIHDGLAYQLPVIVTEQMRREWSPDVLSAYIRESALASSMAARSFQFQFDTPQRSAADLPVLPVTEDPLLEWNHATRLQVLSNCHAAYMRNPIAFRGLKYYAAFVVGDGFNLTCKNKDVERVLTTFIDQPENAIRANEQQYVIDLLVDGELFERFYQGEGETAGQIIMVPMRPWEVEYIETAPGFFRRPIHYHMQRYLTPGDSPLGGQQTEVENVPADEMLHVAINRHRYELRGRPELYGVLPWLRAYKEWLENRARQNYWRNALLWFVRVAQATPQAVAAVLARWSRPPSPGSVAVESDKVEVQALANPVGASDAGEDGRQLKIMNAVGMGLPEYFLGDGANANLATTKSQQLPALMTFGQMQQLLIEALWYPVFRRVIQVAIDAGDLPDEVEEQDADGDPIYEDPEPDELAQPPTQQPMQQPTVARAQSTNGNGSTNGSVPADQEQPAPVPEPKPKTVRKIAALDAFDVSYEPIGDKEPFTLAQALQIAVQNEWLSNESAATEMGYDYQIEKKKILRERATERDEVAQGLRPPPFDPMAALAGQGAEDGE